MKKLKAAIIDDELPARKLLNLFLSKDERCSIVGEAENGFEGLKLIKRTKPDIIFLDVQMPKLNGFEMLDLLDQPIMVVFSTAFDQYAIEAFNKSAIDYLLKPYSEKRFKASLEKILLNFNQNKIDRNQEKDNQSRFDHFKIERLDQIVFKEKDAIILKPLNQIRYISSFDDYVKVHCTDKVYLKQKTMKFYENALVDSGFIRIHRSTLVNEIFVKSLHLMQKDSYELLLKNNERLKVSKSGYKTLKERLHL